MYNLIALLVLSTVLLFQGGCDGCSKKKKPDQTLEYCLVTPKNDIVSMDTCSQIKLTITGDDAEIVEVDVITEKKKQVVKKYSEKSKVEKDEKTKTSTVTITKNGKSVKYKIESDDKLTSDSKDWTSLDCKSGLKLIEKSNTEAIKSCNDEAKKKKVLSFCSLTKAQSDVNPDMCAEIKIHKVDKDVKFVRADVLPLASDKNKRDYDEFDGLYKSTISNDGNAVISFTRKTKKYTYTIMSDHVLTDGSKLFRSVYCDSFTLFKKDSAAKKTACDTQVGKTIEEFTFCSVTERKLDENPNMCTEIKIYKIGTKAQFEKYDVTKSSSDNNLQDIAELVKVVSTGTSDGKTTLQPEGSGKTTYTILSSDVLYDGTNYFRSVYCEDSFTLLGRSTADRKSACNAQAAKTKNEFSFCAFTEGDNSRTKDACTAIRVRKLGNYAQFEKYDVTDAGSLTQNTAEVVGVYSTNLVDGQTTISGSGLSNTYTIISPHVLSDGSNFFRSVYCDGFTLFGKTSANQISACGDQAAKQKTDYIFCSLTPANSGINPNMCAEIKIYKSGTKVQFEKYDVLRSRFNNNLQVTEEVVGVYAGDSTDGNGKTTINVSGLSGMITYTILSNQVLSDGTNFYRSVYCESSFTLFNKDSATQKSACNVQAAKTKKNYSFCRLTAAVTGTNPNMCAEIKMYTLDTRIQFERYDVNRSDSNNNQQNTSEFVSVVSTSIDSFSRTTLQPTGGSGDTYTILSDKVLYDGTNYYRSVFCNFNFTLFGKSATNQKSACDSQIGHAKNLTFCRLTVDEGGRNPNMCAEIIIYKFDNYIKFTRYDVFDKLGDPDDQDTRSFTGEFTSVVSNDGHTISVQELSKKTYTILSDHVLTDGSLFFRSVYCNGFTLSDKNSANQKTACDTQLRKTIEEFSFCKLTEAVTNTNPNMCTEIRFKRINNDVYFYRYDVGQSNSNTRTVSTFSRRYAIATDSNRRMYVRVQGSSSSITYTIRSAEILNDGTVNYTKKHCSPYFTLIGKTEAEQKADCDAQIAQLNTPTEYHCDANSGVVYQLKIERFGLHIDYNYVAITCSSGSLATRSGNMYATKRGSKYIFKIGSGTAAGTYTYTPGVGVESSTSRTYQDKCRLHDLSTGSLDDKKDKCSDIAAKF